MSKRNSFQPATVDGLEARIALSAVGPISAETAKPVTHQQQPTQKVEHHHHHFKIHWGGHHHSGHHGK